MATGKTTLGARLAARLELPFVDTDRIIEERAGRLVSDVWRAEGEAFFREREAEIARELLADGAPVRVIAFGGGTVTRASIRRFALERAFVVTLTASPETISTRAGSAEDRPNLAAPDRLARAAELLGSRAAAYAECHLSLPTDDVDPDDLVDAIVAEARRQIALVPLGERSYLVEFCNDEPTRLTDVIARLAPSKVIVVTDANVARARKKALAAALDPLPFSGKLVTLAAGEMHKNIGSVGAIWDAALGEGIDRSAVLVAFGGGVVGDLTGFAAATLLRGLRFVQVPTTILAMADSSVGGKTGFDHPTGKNLIGAIHQPSAVVVDVAHADSLPPRERAAGLAEVVKIALALDAGLFEWMEANAAELAHGTRETILEAMRRGVALKARIVAEDEREGGPRALLNLGHTVGHALEAKGNYRALLHGEAVALGILAELVWGARRGRTPVELLARSRTLLEALGLPIHLRKDDILASWAYLERDKKRAGGAVKLPVVCRLGAATIEETALSDLLAATEAQTADFLALGDLAG